MSSPFYDQFRKAPDQQASQRGFHDFAETEAKWTEALDRVSRLLDEARLQNAVGNTDGLLDALDQAQRELEDLDHE